jgi:hypothetical protein
VGNDLRLQFSGAGARAYPSVINVHSDGVIDAGGKLSIGGDDGGTYLGLNGTLNIFEGGVVKADGWDLRKGAHVVINAGSLLQIEGNQITAADGYIGFGYITSATLISVTYDAEQNQTLISAAIPPGGYNAWASVNSVGAADADDDGDGWENLLEYAIGGNPKSGSDTKPAIVKIGNSLRYSFKRRNDDSGLTFALQGSPGLMNETWTNLDPAVSIDSTNGKYDNVTLTIAEEASRYFLRLKVASTK